MNGKLLLLLIVVAGMLVTPAVSARKYTETYSACSVNGAEGITVNAQINEKPTDTTWTYFDSLWNYLGMESTSSGTDTFEATCQHLP